MHRSRLGESLMGSQIVVLCFFVACSFPIIFAQEGVTITIKGSVAAAETDDNFVCATLDWWPPEKCNYNQCPWGLASVLNLDVDHPFLANAIREFKTLRIRIGGSLQDKLTYEVPGSNSKCLPFKKKAGALFGFSYGCLSLYRWDKINALFQKTGAIVTFGLNALQGRHPNGRGPWVGAWNSSNARKFMEYTLSKGYPVDSWGFGNELSGHGVGAHVECKQYAKDLIELNAVVGEVYKSSSSRPLIVAPGGFFEKLWYGQLLQDSGANIINAVTHHIYNLGAGNDPRLVERILDPKYLNRITNEFQELQMTIQRHGPWSFAWVGESGGAYNSGGRSVSNTFLNSFWYLDQLGMAAKFNTKVYCRQALIGGNYGLLDTESFVPNPDYYSALLWNKLMGKRVLSTDISGSPYLRAYAHCRKHGPGISLVLINLSKETKFHVAVRNDISGSKNHSNEDDSLGHGLQRSVPWMVGTFDASAPREEYHLTAKNGYHRSRTMLLNGIPLELTENGDIPTLNPVLNAVHSPISISPLSIAFYVFPNFEAQACS